MKNHGRSVGDSGKYLDCVDAQRAQDAAGNVVRHLFNDPCARFGYARDPDRVVINMHNSHLWDSSTIAALDAITENTSITANTSTSSGLTAPASRCPNAWAGNSGQGTNQTQLQLNRRSKRTGTLGIRRCDIYRCEKHANYPVLARFS
ncbi:hypothetical protein GCM10009628_10800 [Paeniglutamicibacter kerguelensis]|uniref:Uncharacterized protein n=1 Tax=Paeniglutamicibacter kerguelensis TaxID=254788 RepID=A0ABS4XCW0_9MICC|nr:hypothetical protein [Paeniglutamicibacter kerguelensis]